jgi:hypothetical protein
VVLERYFVVMSIGHSGSAWLAKVLNSHFDVMCFHELEIITYADGSPSRLRSYFDFSQEELLRNLLYIFSPCHRYVDTYKALGSVGGALSVEETLAALTTLYPEAYSRTRFSLLMRNPISQIHSAAAGNSAVGMGHEPRVTTSVYRWAGNFVPTLEMPLRAMLHALLEVGDPELQSFLYASLGYLSALRTARALQERLSYDPVLRLEELTQDPDTLRHKLQEMTGLDYALPPQLTEKVNVKSGANPPQALFRAWPEEWQRLFWMMFEGRAKLLADIGYDLGDLTSPAAGCPVLARLPAPAQDATELQLQWEAAQRSLRETRAELATAYEMVDDLRARLETAAANGAKPHERVPLLAALTTRLRQLSRRYPRFFSPIKWATREPRRLFARDARNAA